MKNKKILVCGAGGFIGSHLVKKLKSENHFVVGADIKYPEYSESPKLYTDEFYAVDLRQQNNCNKIFSDIKFDEVYQLAADMGGAGYIFSGNHDADVMNNSALINLNILDLSKKHNVEKIFFSSSACIYPAYNQKDPNNPKCSEESAYPAEPDSEYGWEKLFSERLYLSYMRNYGMNVKIARFHNIFGPEGSWNNGKEKSPAAVCRKIAEATDKNNTIEIWGDGNQTRSFLYIDECLNGVAKLMESNHSGPFNIGSDEMVSINQLVEIVKKIANKPYVNIKHIAGPLGVRGRNSDNTLIFDKLNWKPSYPLSKGLEKTYNWILEQVLKNKTKG